MKNTTTISNFYPHYPYIAVPTYSNTYTGLYNSYENYGFDNTGEAPSGGLFTPSGSVLNESAKPLALLFLIDKIVSVMPTQNNAVRTCTKAVQSDLLQEIHDLFDVSSASSFSQDLFRLLRDYQAQDTEEHSDMAYKLSKLSVCLENLQRLHDKTKMRIAS